MSSIRRNLLSGTLDMLILRTLAGGPLHGYAIARAIQEASGGIVRVEQGSLYPALRKAEGRGWLDSAWDVTHTKRRARVYELTRSGRQQLAADEANWGAFVGGVARVLGQV
jgi:transcriptional regulator